MVNPAKNASPMQCAPGQTTPVSRARYRLLCSLLTTYTYGLVVLAMAPALFPVRHPPAWVTVSEIGVAMLFLAMAFFIAPRGEK